MDPADRDERLSRIATQWTALNRAHGDPADETVAAQWLLLERYRGAVYRYLFGAVRDPDAAEELCQEFALRFLRGDFRRASPTRGRFRDYLKTALIHLVTDYHRTRQARPQPLASDIGEPATPLADGTDPEHDFLVDWREELLDRTWQALERANKTYHATLRLRIEFPDLSSQQMAERLRTQLGRPVSAALVRKALERSHDKFADLLLDDVAASLESPTPEQLEAELRALDLLKYCRSALERRG